MSEKQLSFKGELRLLEKKEKRRQAVELWLLNNETTLNGGRYTKLEEHKKGFLNTPILTAYIGDKIGDGHNFKEVFDKNGGVRASFMDAFAERIVGWFDADESNIRVENRDGKEWIVGKGYISTWYAPELTEKLRRQGAMSISIETLVWDIKTENGVEVYDEYEILGTTILGDDVPPAVVGANVSLLNALGAERVKTMTIKVASAEQKKTKTKLNKGEKRMLISEVKAAFPAYKVVAVKENNVVLLNSANALVLTTAEKDGEKVVTGKEKEVVLSASCVIDENTSIDIPLEAVIEAATEKVTALQAKLTEAESARDAALKALEKAQKTESERRVNEVKECISQRAKDLEVCYGASVDAELLSRMLSDESVSKYAAMEDADGRFCGVEAAMKDIDYAYNEARMESERQKNNSHYAWDFGLGRKGEDKNESAEDAALRRIMA